MNIEKCVKLINAIAANVEKCVVGKREAVELSLVGLLARSHILIEDVPGIGKTTLAMALARSVDGAFRRIQMTADMLPSDVIGGLVFNPRDQQFEVRWGPIHGNFILCDEINRATPKTQSALLECMAEGQVTIDRESLRLSDPFMVIATQNPTDYEGCYMLGESQKDRFLLSFKMGYPGRDAEREILASHARASLDFEGIGPVATARDVASLQNEAAAVKTTRPVLDYILDIADETRRDPRVSVGVSPRGAIMLKSAACALALVRGRDHVIFDDVKYIAPFVIAHRMQLSADRLLGGEAAAAEIVADCLSRVRVAA